jgi:hypothetical protein
MIKQVPPTPIKISGSYIDADTQDFLEIIRLNLTNKEKVNQVITDITISDSAIAVTGNVATFSFKLTSEYDINGALIELPYEAISDCVASVVDEAPEINNVVGISSAPIKGKYIYLVYIPTGEITISGSYFVR